MLISVEYVKLQRRSSNESYLYEKILC
jgi:hypothetical protein